MNAIPGFQKIPVKTWYLTFGREIPEIHFTAGSISIEQWENPSTDEYLELYQEVGSAWGWTGRLLKSADELAGILNSEENEIWLFRVDQELAGFFELVRAKEETELVYLGLKPDWIGKGLGQKLIQTAVSISGQNGQKVWLHTCERDHPEALKAYLKAGFTIEKELISIEYYPE